MLGVTFLEQDNTTAAQQDLQGTTGYIAGVFGSGPTEPANVASVEQFENIFGRANTFASVAARNFLKNSQRLTVQRVLPIENANYAQVVPGYVLGDQDGSAATAAGALVAMLVNFGATGSSDATFASNTVYFSSSVAPWTGGGVLNDNNGATVPFAVALYNSGNAFSFVTASLAGTALPSGAIKLGTCSNAADRDALFAYRLQSASSIADAVFQVKIPTGSADTVGRTVSISLNPASDLHFSKVLNTDLSLLKRYGHAVVQRSDWSYEALKNFTPVAQTSSCFVSLHNVGPYAASRYGSRLFNSYAVAAKTPYIHSQLFGGSTSVAATDNPGGITYPLFRLVSTQLGECANGLRIKISNIRKSTEPGYDFGTFDLAISDKNGVNLEKFISLSLDPTSPQFISKVVGDRRLSSYDSESQQLQYTGTYRGSSAFAAVELFEDDDGNTLETAPGVSCPAQVVPWGFEGYETFGYLMSDATGQTTSLTVPTGSDSRITIAGLQKTPLVARQYVNNGWNANRPWGVRVTKYGSDNSDTGSKVLNVVDESLWTKWQYAGAGNSSAKDYVGSAHTAYFISNSRGPTSKDSVLFSLHYVSGTGLTANLTGTSQLATGDLRKLVYNTTLTKPPLLNFNSIQGTAAAQFELVLSGGFDGWLSSLYSVNGDPTPYIGAGITVPTYTSSNTLVRYTSGNPSTNVHTAALMTAIELFDAQDDKPSIAAIPGARNDTVVSSLLEACQRSGMTQAIVDFGGFKEANADIITTRQQTLQYDNSHGAAYARWPIVRLARGQKMPVPPSTVIVGVIARSDKLKDPWYVPAGTTRGALAEFDVIDLDLASTKKDTEALIDVQVNILTRASQKYVAWGNKTLRQRKTATQQLSIRRMLNEFKAVIGNAIQGLVFEPNNPSAWTQFTNLVSPYADSVKRRNGLTSVRIICDETTNTPDRQREGTLVGKIAIVPTYSIDEIEVPFTLNDQNSLSFGEIN